MFKALLRVLLGLVLACLAAGLAQVAFAWTPAGIAQSGRDAGELVLLAATHFVLFSAPFALVAAAIGEWQSIRGWTYYAFVAIAIAFAGFLAQYASEGSDATILNNYAFKAFLTTGFIAGFVYWAIAGRRAGEDPPEPPRRRPSV